MFKRSLALTGLLAVSPMVNAIAVGTYSLSNHPDGSAGEPGYGLRLDGLVTGNSETYTFDFDHASSNMQLTFDGSTLVIDGQAFGGQDAGSDYLSGTTALWDIHFEYTVSLTQPGDGGLDDVIVITGNANFGTINSTEFGDFELADKSNGDYSFQLGDEGGSGHRGYDGISGWGWLKHGANCTGGGAIECQNVQYSDWLFTAQAVPVPAAVWLFGTALVGLYGIKKRKQS